MIGFCQREAHLQCVDRAQKVTDIENPYFCPSLISTGRDCRPPAECGPLGEAGGIYSQKAFCSWSCASVCVCPTRISQCYSLSHTHFPNSTLLSSRAPQPWKPSSLSPIRPLINSIKQRRDTLSNSLSDDVMPSRTPLSKFPH